MVTFKLSWHTSNDREPTQSQSDPHLFERHLQPLEDSCHIGWESSFLCHLWGLQDTSALKLSPTGTCKQWLHFPQDFPGTNWPLLGLSPQSWWPQKGPHIRSWELGEALGAGISELVEHQTRFFLGSIGQSPGQPQFTAQKQMGTVTGRCPSSLTDVFIWRMWPPRHTNIPPASRPSSSHTGLQAA